jgi:protein-tyrosine phosphatase
MTTLPRTDFHSHLMPGVDDGARDESFSAGALARFRGEGVGQVITTPHFTGSVTLVPEALAARLTELDAGWAALQRVAQVEGAPHGGALHLSRGAEVMLDIPDPDLSDERLRLAGGPFVLVEFPGLQLPPLNAEYAIVALRQKGWRPVVAHPERYRNLDEGLTTLARFRSSGGWMQLNAGSLMGAYGAHAAACAQRLLARGWADYASSDYHARGEPGVAAFVAQLDAMGASEQAELLTVVNPARLLAGEPPLAVPPVAFGAAKTEQARSLWARLFGRS